MKKEFYQMQGGQLYRVGRHETNSAFEQLTNRLKHSIPIEMIDADQMRKMISGVNVKCDRSLTPEEAAQLLESVKGFLLNAVDSMPKVYAAPGSVGNVSPGKSGGV